MRHIQTLVIAFLAIILGITSACNKEEDLGRGVDLPFRQTLEIPAGIGVFDVHHFYLYNIPTRYSDVLSQVGIGPDQVLRVVTTKGSIAGLFGDANLDFVDRVSLRVFKDDPTNYLEIAYRDPSPVDPGNTIGLIPSLSDSKQFFNEDRVNFDLVFWLRRTTQESTPLQLDLNLWIGY
jgi:hypothetical protein